MLPQCPTRKNFARQNCSAAGFCKTRNRDVARQFEFASDQRMLSFHFLTYTNELAVSPPI